MRSLASLLFLTLSLCLTSCGFHLRGYAPLSPALQQMYIAAPTPYTKFYSLLMQSLEDRGIKPATIATENNFILRILDEQYNRVDGSVSAATNTRDYILYYSIRYEIVSPTGIKVIAPQNITVTRTLTVNIDAMLASNYEEETIKDEMQLDIIYQLLTRLASPQVTAALGGPPTIRDANK